MSHSKGRELQDSMCGPSALNGTLVWRGGTSASGEVKDHPEDAGSGEGEIATKARGWDVKPKASPPLPLTP